MNVFGSPEARSKSKGSILTKACSNRCAENHNQCEDQISGGRNVAEVCRRDGEKGKNDEVDHEGDEDSFRVVGLCLKITQNQHRREVGYAADGGNGRLETLEDSLIVLESSLEVGSGGEEHVPRCILAEPISQI